MSIILNGLLQHVIFKVIFAKVSEEVITDDSIDCLEALACSCLLVIGSSRCGDCLEGSNDGGASGGCSDGGHE